MGFWFSNSICKISLQINCDTLLVIFFVDSNNTKKVLLMWFELNNNKYQPTHRKHYVSKIGPTSKEFPLFSSCVFFFLVEFTQTLLLLAMLCSAWISCGLICMLLTYQGEFDWRFRSRIRITLFGENIFDPPVELHEQELLNPEFK